MAGHRGPSEGRSYPLWVSNYISIAKVEFITFQDLIDVVKQRDEGSLKALLYRYALPHGWKQPCGIALQFLPFFSLTQSIVDRVKRYKIYSKGEDNQI
jgi:hypothetical protein